MEDPAAPLPVLRAERARLPLPLDGLDDEPPAGEPAVTAKHAGTAGDEILIASSGHSAASPDRRGEIVAVLGEAGCECYLVRWPDGRTSLLAAAAGTVVPCRGAARPAPARMRA